jgi:hypothetical protein
LQEEVFITAAAPGIKTKLGNGTAGFHVVKIVLHIFQKL